MSLETDPEKGDHTGGGKPIWMLHSGYDSGNAVEGELKMLAASLQRTMCAADIVAFNRGAGPLFFIERCHFEEVAWNGNGGLFFQILGKLEHMKGPEDRWVVFAETGGIAMRSIDHLLGLDSCESCPPLQEPEFLYLTARGGAARCHPGLWAVRLKLAASTLRRWALARETAPPDSDPGALWTTFVHRLNLRKRKFEVGEVLAPEAENLDWKGVMGAAYVSVSHWGAEERYQFLQAIYFNTFFGDRSGLMLNMLEP